MTSFDSAAFWPLIITASLVVTLARTMRLSVLKAIVVLGGPALIFITLKDENSTSLAGPLTGAAVAWLALTLILRIPLRIAITLVLVPIIFGGMSFAVITVLYSEPSLLGQS